MDVVLDVHVKDIKTKSLLIQMLSRYIFHNMEEYLYSYAHEEEFISHDIRVEMMVGSTSSSNNMHEDVDVTMHRL